MAELANKGILKGVDKDGQGTHAGAAAELEEKLKKEGLEKKLAEQMRPGGPAQKVSESLEAGLAQRASAQDLKATGVLKGGGVDSTIAGVAAAMEEKMIKVKHKHAIPTPALSPNHETKKREAILKARSRSESVIERPALKTQYDYNQFYGTGEASSSSSSNAKGFIMKRNPEV